MNVSSWPFFVRQSKLKDARTDDLTAKMIPHRPSSVSQTTRVTLLLDVLKGVDDHYRAEAAFKAVAGSERVAGREGES
jgi:imidazoleglycerol-phosphate dehydratase